MHIYMRRYYENIREYLHKRYYARHPVYTATSLLCVVCERSRWIADRENTGELAKYMERTATRKFDLFPVHRHSNLYTYFKLLCIDTPPHGYLLHLLLLRQEH